MTKVIIIGCGMAGPTLAIFLKRLGFEPVIYERAKEFADAGLSLLSVRLWRSPALTTRCFTDLRKVYSPTV
jgi:2-polyprenyl-6-methoxyphenol hydroxylase-like FAD-dependent oxidoreductase